MRKVALIMVITAFGFALPVLAVSSNANSNSLATKTSFTEDAQGIKDRITEMKAARAELQAAKKAEIATSAKNVATKKLTSLINRFESMKKRVENMTVISDARKTELTAQIDAEIDKLDALKAELSTATTVAQVNEIMTRAKTQVTSSKTIVKDIVAAIHATHLENIITKLNAVLAKIQKKIDALSGGETAEMKAEKDAYALNIKAAQDAITAKDFKTAKEKLLLARKNLVKLNQLTNVAKTKTTGTEASTQTESE